MTSVQIKKEAITLESFNPNQSSNGMNQPSCSQPTEIIQLKEGKDDNERHQATIIQDDDDIKDERANQTFVSKNQMKKRRRYEKLMAIKKRKKQQDKEAKAAKAKAEGRDLEAERKFQAERALSGEGHLKREKKWLKKLKASEESLKICVDCSFAELMTKKEIGSLSNQIRYCYAANKRSDQPVYLSVSSLSGETYDNLKRVEGFPDNWRARAFDCSENSLTEMHVKDDLVYLTSDSSNILHELDNSKIYVIGGIVDRNRLKGVTFNKASELGIKTARLPIDEHLQLFATKVLTCNHVFEILLKFQEHNDWKKALLDVLPARKDIISQKDSDNSNSSHSKK